MATIEQLYGALAKADAAGDTYAANNFAGRIKALKAAGVTDESTGATSKLQDENLSELKEGARTLATSGVKALDAIPEMGNSMLSALAWAGNKVGIGDGTYVPAETFSEIEPAWMKPQTEWGDTASTVGSVIAGAPDAPLVAGRVLRRGVEEVAARMLPKVNEELMQAAAEMGIKPTPAIATGSVPAAQFEQEGARVPVVGKRIEDFRGAEAAALDEYAKSAASDRDVSPTALGVKIKAELEDYPVTAKSEYDNLYEQVVSRVPLAEKASIDNLQSMAKIIDRRYENDPIMQKYASKFISDLANESQMTWHVMRDTETKLGEQIAGTGKHKQFAGLGDGDLKQMYGALKEDITNHLLHNYPRGAHQLRMADEAFKDAKSATEGVSKFLGRGRTADEVYASIFGAPEKAVKTPHVEQIKALKQVLSPDAMNAVQAEYIARMGDGGAGAGSGFNPAAFATNMEELYRAHVIDELFAPSQIKSLENLNTYSNAVKDAGRAQNWSGTAPHNRTNEAMEHPIKSAVNAIPTAIFARVITNPEFLTWLQRITAGGLVLQDDVEAINAKWLLRAINAARAEYFAVGVNAAADNENE